MYLRKNPTFFFIFIILIFLLYLELFSLRIWNFILQRKCVSYWSKCDECCQLKLGNIYLVRNNSEFFFSFSGRCMHEMKWYLAIHVKEALISTTIFVKLRVLVKRELYYIIWLILFFFPKLNITLTVFL